MLTGYSANLPNDVLFDTGVLYVAAAVLGATRGAPKWDPAFTIENLNFDGKHAPIKGLDRKFYGEAKITATLLEFGPAASGNQIAKLETGIAVVDTGTTPDTLSTFTPRAGGILYVAGDYLSNVRLMFERGIVAGASIKKYAAILLPAALVMKWDLQGQDKDGAIISIEICGRKDMASGTTADAPYKIELRENATVA